LTGQVGQKAKNYIQVYSGRRRCEVVKLSTQQDHIHLISNVPLKVSISKFMGTLKGRTATRVFSNFRYLKKKPYWGKHFWAPGYCGDTVGLDTKMIGKYVKYQETLNAEKSSCSSNSKRNQGTTPACLRWGQASPLFQRT